MSSRSFSRLLPLMAASMLSIPALVQAAEPQQGTRITAIDVVGTQRIEPGTVVSYLPVKVGENVSRATLSESIAALFATGLFADVSLSLDGSVLKVMIVENPVVNQVVFEGADAIKEEDLKAEVQLKSRLVFTPARAKADAERIQALYRRQGRYSAVIEPQVVQQEQNRVDVIFKITEGPRAKVRDIQFTGNEIYSDDDLRAEVSTKQARWYRFLSSDDTYDSDRVNYDKELLRRFYLSKGYVDFRVVSAVTQLSPDKSSFYIHFTVEEGKRYKVGKTAIVADVPDVKTDGLDALITLKSQEWYDAGKIEDTIDLLSESLGNQGLAFVQVEPRIRRHPETTTVDVDFVIAEGERTTVDNIIISGNSRTEDNVIRRQMLLKEGDAFAAARLRRSEQQIKDLGFFKDVKVDVERGDSPNSSNIAVKVEEQSTGELSVGAGFSTTDGALVDLRVRERNLLGQGKDLSLSTTFSKRTREFDLGFTQPYFLDRNLSLGIDAFHTTRDFQDEASYDQRQSGFGFRTGYPLGEHLTQRLNYRFENNSIDNVASTASTFIQQQAGDRLTSSIGTELLWDYRDSKLTPRDGFMVRVSGDYAGIGGDVNYVRGLLSGGYYVPVFAKSVLALTAETGAIKGLSGDDVNISDRYFIGGDSLRGFRVGGIGPRDTLSGDALGGNLYARGTAEFTFPLNLADQLGLKAHLFSDAGTLSDLDIPAGTVTTNIVDDSALRASYGAGISWKSPLGPIRVDLARPIASESYDRKESFRFSFGTRF